MEREHNNAIRLSVEGSLTAFVVGAWLWGVVSLGAQAMVAQMPLSSNEDLPGYVLACPAALSSEEDIGSAGSDDGCLREVRSHVETSRQPGTGLTEHAHRADS